ncbi:uncharacterized protein N7482_005627 [Penicillium canariense]|uniref:Ketoreductase (KR) domain-containing protein n=1 Tax=Penicillium canariense TaxID=189055 RepID=A0A9W9I4A9_9EURO|nr:uncharacterized protein N7482_005627 [Penicillium canariense]KAJ5166846.1 hypothetical protein N7482_005627 [Penicillium canariense]
MPSNLQRTVLVTGGTSGLGYHCALAIARQRPDYQVVIASRSDPTASADALNSLLDQQNVQFLKLDLSSLANVRLFAADWEALPRGVEYTEDGFEKTFAISHIGHALLFSLLRPYLANTARVVIVSSGTHDPEQKTGMPDANYQSAKDLAYPPSASVGKNGRQHYTNTKLANVLYSYALHRRFESINEKHGRHWTVVAFDPGLMPGTGLARGAHWVLKFLWSRVLPNIIPFLRLVLSPNVHRPQESGESLARLAVDSDVEGMSGVYFEGRKKIKSSTASYDESKQEDLWQWTITTLVRDDKERATFSLSTLI